MNSLKESVAHTSGEVKGLSAQLQAKDDLLQKLLTQSTHVAQEQLQRLTAEMSELRSRLSKAEDEQQKAQLQMYTAHLKHELLQNVVTTLPDEVNPYYESSSLFHSRLLSHYDSNYLSMLNHTYLSNFSCN